MDEPILDPARPIIDPHHHLWDLRRQTQANMPFADELHKPLYLLSELLDDVNSGHDIRATVHVEADSMYRARGPAELASVGETEFANGIAAMGASGIYGECRPCAGIIGYADLRLGAHASKVLEAHLAAAADRFRGIRQCAAHDTDPAIRPYSSRIPQQLYLDARFREGFSLLAPFGPVFDAWLLEPQLADLIDLARAFPDTHICLDHVGTPLGIGAHAGRREQRFDLWRSNIRSLARCENVTVKLGGLGMHYCGFPSLRMQTRATSEQLAAEWRPYIETCIEVFTPSRAMFESNFPVDAITCSYSTLWNAFKRLAQPYSEAEKHDLFFGTAQRFYRLQLD